MGNLATVGNRQLASRVRPIVELWLAERVARAAFDTGLDDLDPDQWLRTYFVAGGLMTVLRQQAADSPASAVGTEEMAHALPVSYTHLDVYKRQPCGGRRPRCPRGARRSPPRSRP